MMKSAYKHFFAFSFCLSWDRTQNFALARLAPILEIYPLSSISFNGYIMCSRYCCFDVRRLDCFVSLFPRCCDN